MLPERPMDSTAANSNNNVNLTRPSLSPASSIYVDASDTLNDASDAITTNTSNDNGSGLAEGDKAHASVTGSASDTISSSHPKDAAAAAASGKAAPLPANSSASVTAAARPSIPGLSAVNKGIGSPTTPVHKQSQEGLMSSNTVVESPTSLRPPGKDYIDAREMGKRVVEAANRTSSLSAGPDDTTLTPLRAHYLKKSLVTLQFSKELLGFTNLDPRFPTLSPLSYLGAPFTPPPKGAPQYMEVPFMKFMFRQFVLTFPFIQSAPKDLFPSKVQPFVGSLVARNLSTTDDVLGMDEQNGEDPEVRSRQKIISKAEKYFSLLLGSALKLVEPEEVVRLSQRDLDRLEVLARRRQAKQAQAREAFDVNIICVRTVVEKGRVRSRVHEEFVIRTRRKGWQDVLVSRRYGDFKTLADELRKAHPDFEIRGPPPKDRTAVTLSQPPPKPSPLSSTTPTSAGFRPQDMLQRTDTVLSTDSGEEVSNARPSPQSVTASSLAREKNRVTLRSYLHGLLSSFVVANSPVMRSFLMSGPTTLTPEEQADARHREDADRLREEGRKRFAREVAARVDGLRNAVRSVKSDMMGKNGLVNIFATVKATPIAKDLPPNYRAVLEWGRITLASTIFQTFIASDDASGTLAALKRFHGLMPYFMLKGILRVSNPMAMIRGVMDLFMAQPFGGKSLLQRMFTSSLIEEARALQEDIAAVSEKVGDPVLCEKIRLFVYAPKEIQGIYRMDAAMEEINPLTAILRSSEAPLLNRAQMHRVLRAAKAHKEYMSYRETLNDSDDDDGPEEEEAWLFEDLNILAKLYSRLRDKEQLIDLIFEGTTSELLKDMFAIFYAPLAQVYKAASIADSLGDLQNFITDLIRTIESCETLSQEDPHQTVQMFINLVERHEQAFYSFVHKVQTKGEGLFDSLMHWIELFLTLVRDGFGQQVSLEFILPHTGAERKEIMQEIDEVALYYYKMKLFYEEKLRRRFGRAQARANADADDAAAQELVDGVVKELSFGELVKEDANDIAAEATETETESESEEDDDDDDDDEDEEDEEDEEEDESSSEESSESENTAPTPKASPPAVASTPASRQARRPVQPTGSSASTPRSRSRPNDGRNRPMYQQAGQGPLPPTPVSSTPQTRLRPSKSFSGSPISTPSSSNVPPVPRIQDKALPPAPRSAGSNQPTRTPPMTLPTNNGRHARHPSSHKKKRKVGPASIEHPELKHIPKLLPVFLEMIKPLLRPQAV